MTNENNNNSLIAEPENDEEFRNRYGEHIGSGMTAVIYARDGIVAKVFREGQRKTEVFKEAFILSLVGELGIPAPNVYSVETFCGRTAVLMDQVRGISIADIIQKNPEKTDYYLDRAVELQIAMHKVSSSEFRPMRMMLNGMITASPGLSPEEKERLCTMLSELPDGLSICHGDFHPGNILLDGESYKIIDWAEVTCGCPAGDACRSYMDYSMTDKEMGEMYLGKYCAASGRTREEILTWLPVVAGAVYGFLSEEGKRIARQFF